MNRIEAKIILMCQGPRTTSQIWGSFHKQGTTYTYNYINGKLSSLHSLGFMGKRRLGNVTYYRSRKDAILAAVAFLNRLFDEQQRMEEMLAARLGSSSRNKKLIEYT